MICEVTFLPCILLSFIQRSVIQLFLTREAGMNVKNTTYRIETVHLLLPILGSSSNNYDVIKFLSALNPACGQKQVY